MQCKLDVRSAPWLVALALGSWALASPAGAATFRIEIDYMVDTDHSHRPTTAEIQAVQQMFACEGHTLIVSVDDAITHYDVLIRDPNNNDFFAYDGAVNSYGAIRDQFFDNDGNSDWYYCLFAHQYEDTVGSTTTSSGIAQLSNRLSLVSLGAFDGETGTPFDKASTLAHEFGHNLGLRHCGTMNCDDSTLNSYVGNGPPTVASVMSYQYQLAGIRAQLSALGMIRDDATIFKNLDYSRGTMCGQTENNLDEDFGTGMLPFDWNCDNVTGGIVVQELLSEGNNDPWCGKTGNTSASLLDLDEWNFIDFTFNSKPRDPFDPSAEPEVVSCITKEESDRIFETLGHSSPPLVTESCRTGKMVYLHPTTTNTIQSGVCNFPVKTFPVAVDNVATSGSELYLRPGTYSIGTGPYVISKAMKIYSVGSAIVE